MADTQVNDAQIIEYLRSRSQVEPPHDLAVTVMSAVDAAPPARSWFTPFLPAAAFAAVAAAFVVLALVIGQPPSVGPVPPGSGQPSSPAPASPEASPEPSPPGLSLLEPGASVEISAVDARGEWGTIRIERGEDLGGYADAAIDPDSFVIELFISYDAERMPEPDQFGESDWLLRPVDPDAEHFFAVEPRQFDRANGVGVRPEAPLAIFPGAIDIFTTPTEGNIAFGVSRRESNLALELVYQPPGAAGVTTILVREPGPPPATVAVATPSPPADVEYVEIDGLPFSVIDSPEADALFERPDSCANPEPGYTVTFPDDWYTNTETGDVPACAWFTPDFFEVSTPGQTPDGIWISIGVVDGIVAYTSLTDIPFSEELTIDGREGRRVEFNPNPNAEPNYRAYHYVIVMGENGPTFVASTDVNQADDYVLAKAVLDRIVASLAFDE